MTRKQDVKDKRRKKKAKEQARIEKDLFDKKVTNRVRALEGLKNKTHSVKGTIG